MTRRIATVVLLVAAGCTPQNATLTDGSYKAFLAERSSGSLITGSVDFSAGDGVADELNCQCTIVYVESADDSVLDGSVCENDSVYYGGYCWACAEFLDGDGDGEPDGDASNYDDFADCFDEISYNYDFDIDGNAEITNAEKGQWVHNTLDGDSEKTAAPRFSYETWPHVDNFQSYTEPLDPWRGEAVLTSEGDFQVTFHHYLPGGADFRFGFVVDPNFAPRDCEADGDDVVEVEIDGDWLTEWSNPDNYLEDFGPPSGDGEFFLLNAGAFQFDPTETDAWQTSTNYWYFPDSWQAGFAFAEFADESAFLRRSQYAQPLYYLLGEESDLGAPSPLYPNYYADLEEGAVVMDERDFTDMLTRVEAIAVRTTEELAALGLEDYKPVVQTNTWRTPDGSVAGMDGWVGMHFNWVQIDSGAEYEPGGTVTGRFQLMLDSSDSASTFFVRGEFEADNIKDDFWIANDVLSEKFEENGNTPCGF